MHLRGISGMLTDDKKQFSSVLAGTLSTYDKSVDPAALQVWWQMMQPLTVEQFSEACRQHMLSSKFPPRVLDILELANKGAWPTPDEAWNKFPKTECEAGWTCPEMDAAFGACVDSLDRGDMIAARMAFIGVYEREIQGKVGQKPKWRIT